MTPRSKIIFYKIFCKDGRSLDGGISWSLEFLYGFRTQAIVVFSEYFAFFGHPHSVIRTQIH
jgi:hypothetical protein